jgi:hypothetical protein
MRTTLRIRQEQLMTAEDVAQADTHYTSSTDFDRCTGNASIYVILASAGAGHATITQQCSMDNTTWYDAVNAAGAAVGTVQTAQAVTTGTLITYSPVLTPYIRFKVVEDNHAAVTVSIKLLFQV